MSGQLWHLRERVGSLVHNFCGSTRHFIMYVLVPVHAGKLRVPPALGASDLEGLCPERDSTLVWLGFIVIVPDQSTNIQWHMHEVF